MNRKNVKYYYCANKNQLIVLLSFVFLVVTVFVIISCFVIWYVSLIIIGSLLINVLILVLINEKYNIFFNRIVLDYRNNTIATLPSSFSFRKKIKIIPINKINSIKIAYSKSDSFGNKLLIYTNPEKVTFVRGGGPKIAFHVGFVYCDEGDSYKIMFDYMKNETILSLLRELKIINPSIVIERDYSKIYD